LTVEALYRSQIAAGGTPPTDLTVTLLGPINAVGNGSMLYLGTARQREVLAVLAMRAGTVTSVAQIVDAVWPAQRPNSVENMVHTYVGRLRRALNAGRANVAATVLRSTRPGYVLDIPPDSVDINIYESDVRLARLARTRGDLHTALRLFRQAQHLWRGPALQEAVGPMAEAERVRLEELRQDVAEEQAGVRLLLGDDENLVSELRRMLVEQPLRERLWELLLITLGQTSRRAEALTAYQSARVTLADRLGVEPGQHLQHLHQRLLRCEPVEVRRWWDRKSTVC
jgi:DNA-binding SARP family transcriptional activator